MIDPDILKLMRCPESLQELRLADSELIARCNEDIAKHTLRNRGGQPVTEPIDGGLIRADGTVLYLIRSAIPVLLVEEAIPLERP